MARITRACAPRIAAEFNRAGLATIVSANIVGTMWDKLLVNVATGALSGITRLPYGALYAGTGSRNVRDRRRRRSDGRGRGQRS